MSLVQAAQLLKISLRSTRSDILKFALICSDFLEKVITGDETWCFQLGVHHVHGNVMKISYYERFLVLQTC